MGVGGDGLKSKLRSHCLERYTLIPVGLLPIADVAMCLDSSSQLSSLAGVEACNQCCHIQ